MTKKQKIHLFAYLFCALLLCGGIFTLYIRQLSHAVSTFTVDAMEELVLHDMYNINGTLEHTWDHLESIGERIRSSKPQTFLELTDELYAQQDASPLEGVGLLDEAGLLYTAKQETLQVKDAEYVQKLKNGERKTVLLYKGSNMPELTERALLFAIKIPPFKVEDATLVAAVAVQSISHISDRLKIDCFGGQGFSTLIDEKGDFIVNHSGLGGLPGTNMFEWFSQGTFAKGQSAQQLIAQIQNKEDTLFTYINADGVKKIVSAMHVPDTDWTLIVNIPAAILEKQNKNFISMALIMLGTNIFLLMCLLVYFYRIRIFTADEKTQLRAKEEFLSRLRHEIRTPLNGLIGLHYLMQNHVDDKQQMEEYVQKSVHSVKYLQTVINDMLDFSQLTQDQLVLEKAPFSLDRTLSALESLVRIQTEEKNLRFTLDAHISHPFILGDQMRLEQALANVLNNAIKFTQEGGAVLLRVTQTPPKHGAVNTLFEVEDTGCGMSETQLQRMLDSFHQDTPANGAQTLLGLSVSSLLVKKMGGKINVQSKLGQGSRFTIELPCALANAQEQNSLAQNTFKRKFRPDKKLNVLVAEDNELNAEILIEVLGLEGHRVSWAANGKQTVDLFAASGTDEFDLILMDLEMPVMNGYEATRQIRAMSRPDAKTISIWACTANTFQEDQKSAQDCGMNGFISKPINVKQLLKKLEENS